MIEKSSPIVGAREIGEVGRVTVSESATSANVPSTMTILPRVRFLSNIFFAESREPLVLAQRGLDPLRTAPNNLVIRGERGVGIAMPPELPAPGDKPELGDCECDRVCCGLRVWTFEVPKCL